MESNGRGIFDDVRGSLDSEESGIGRSGNKSATATLRVFDSNLGEQWLEYGGKTGGTQNYIKPRGDKLPAGCNWFVFYYKGLMTIGDDVVFGNWQVRVEGEGMEKLCEDIGKHFMLTLSVGKQRNTDNPASVRSITITPRLPKKLPGQDDDDMEEYQFRG